MSTKLLKLDLLRLSFSNPYTIYIRFPLCNTSCSADLIHDLLRRFIFLINSISVREVSELKKAEIKHRNNDMHSLYIEKRYKNGRAIADSAIVALKASFVSRHHRVRRAINLIDFGVVRTRNVLLIYYSH